MKRLVESSSESGEPIMVEVEEAEDHGCLAERKLKARRAVEDNRASSSRNICHAWAPS